ncbi:DgyrCDS2142 [Dimorphilus gyrociliatus]|uniref:Phospholipid scramblase n=1 Tax=Dimorphilus gyrociliatus TaxID=2664684 RepID=A0A7I8VB68_9ANNE|nr:DgyrCDS2142 [Dimorphilus gyrociliatus]
MSEQVITEEPISDEKHSLEAEEYSNQGLDLKDETDDCNVIQTQPTSEVIPSNPSGLDLIANVDKFHIHQEVQLVEVLTVLEKCNRYKICNDTEQQLFYAKEESECLQRYCCNIFRSLRMEISTSSANGEIPVIALNRPLNCQGFLCPCCLQRMEIYCPPGQLVATIKEMWTMCIPTYEIHDTDGNLLYTIIGDCCHSKCYTDVHFRVLRDSYEVADIQKHWGGFREVCAEANDFTILIHDKSVSVMNKAIMIGAAFLIDYNYFERLNYG